MNVQIASWTLVFLLLWPVTGSAASADFDLNEEVSAFDQVGRPADEDEQILSPGSSATKEVEDETQVWIFRMHLDAGTSVEINVRNRTVPLDLTLSTSGDQPQIIGRALASVSGVMEPVVLAAERTGDYTIRVVPHSAGSYTIAAGAVHPTEERDRKLAEGNRLMQIVRLAYEGTGSLNNVYAEAEKRVQIYRELDCKEGLALALVDVGVLNRFDVEANLPKVQEAENLFRSMGSRPDVLYVLSAKRQLFESRGHYQEAIATENEILEEYKKSNSVEDEGYALIYLGVLYHRLADEEKAREYYDKAYQLAQTVVPETRKSLGVQSVYFTNLANLARGMNGDEIPIEFFPPRTEADVRQALVYLKRSAEIRNEIIRKFHVSGLLIAFTIAQTANTYRELGEYDEALKQIDLLESIAGPPTEFSKTRLLILRGSVYAKMHDLPRTIQAYDEEIALLREGINPTDRAGYLLMIGRDYLELGELKRADDVYREALNVSREYSEAKNTSSSLLGIARVQRELGNFNNAQNAVEEAIQLEEGLRSRITSDELRTTYFASMKRLYDFYVDLLMQSRKSQPNKRFDSLALETTERGRARYLLDLLAMSRIDLLSDVPQELIASQKKVEAELLAKANEQNRLTMGKHTEAAAARISSELNDITERYTAIQAEIRRLSPRYAAITQSGGITAAQIQQMLDTGTVLLEYALGEKTSYLWAVSRDSIVSYDLPSRAEIEAKAREVHAALTARNLPETGLTPAEVRSRTLAADAAFASGGAALSKMLLGPAADLLRDKRLVVVPDGALNYIPFAALPAPASGVAVTHRAQEPNAAATLGTAHEIVTLPSASTLERLREGIQERRSPDKVVAIFADPVFGIEDNRIAAAPKTGSLPGNVFTRDFELATEDVGLAGRETRGLPRLPFTRREADSIYSVSPKALSLRKVGFDASKTAVFGSGLDQYRILHFATHGLLDSQHPELSGVVLSLVDKDSKPVDGFLRLQDIYGLRLNADLVVLSACNTALGKEVRGEGLIGLTRGFMYAGAPRVVASLWKVDDAATAALMSIFYQKMLGDQMRPAAALRAAQMELMKQPRWRSPYYWAPFVLQGEWK